MLLQRRAMLGLRQAELQKECEAQEKRMAAATTRLTSLQVQLRQLAAEQKELGDRLDPEAAALRRLVAAEAAQRAERENRRDVLLLLGGLIGMYGLAASTIAHQFAERKREMRERCFLD